MTSPKQIQAHLDRLLGQARALTEQPIETDIGAVKIADVVWLTREQCQQLLQDPNLPLQPAPPICVEIISPSNTELPGQDRCPKHCGAILCFPAARPSESWRTKR